MKELRAIVEAFERARAAGQAGVLATVVQVTGSAYRRAGARMLVTADGQTAGSVSGGCLERDVLDQASRVLQSSEARVVTYDSMSDADIVWGFGLGCNGIVEVLVEPVSHDGKHGPLAFLADCLHHRQAGVLATVFAAEEGTAVRVGQRAMLSNRWPATHDIGDRDLAEAILGDARATLDGGRSHVRTYETAAGRVEVFIEAIQPPIPLVVFGAGPDAVPLVHFAKQLGWHVTLVDPRPGYADRGRFPSADGLIVCRPEEVLDRIEIEPRTVAALMTHNYLHDLEVLRRLLPTPLRYIGILGPRLRMRKLLDDIRATGQTLSDERLGRLYGPIGLDIGAETPEEIALAVVAEISAVVTGRQGGASRHREGCLHEPSPVVDPVRVSGQRHGQVWWDTAGTQAGV